MHVNNIPKSIAERPELFLKREDITGAQWQFLCWNASKVTQSSMFAQADEEQRTTAVAWEVGGTGPLYKPNVNDAQEMLDRHAAGVKQCQETGQTPPEAPWENFTDLGMNPLNPAGKGISVEQARKAMEMAHDEIFGHIDGAFDPASFMPTKRAIDPHGYEKWLSAAGLAMYRMTEAEAYTGAKV